MAEETSLMAETVVVAVVNEAEVAVDTAEAAVTSLMLVRPAMFATHDHSGGR